MATLVAVGRVPGQNFSVEDEWSLNRAKASRSTPESCPSCRRGAGEERDAPGCDGSPQWSWRGCRRICPQCAARERWLHLLRAARWRVSPGFVVGGAACFCRPNFFAKRAWLVHRIDRAGQHEAERMKEPHPCLIQTVRIGHRITSVRSPISMTARRTSAGRVAAAIASSTRLSLTPMRISPSMSLIRYLASSGVALSRLEQRMGFACVASRCRDLQSLSQYPRV